MWTYLGEEINVNGDGFFCVKGEFFESLAKAIRVFLEKI